MLLENNYNLLTWDEVKELVPQYLETALTLDNQSANIHASRGLFKLTVFEREYTEPALLDAVKAFERAIELNPNYAQAYFWLANAKSDRQLYDESLAPVR